MTIGDPHRGQPMMQTGAAPAAAKVGMIMIHGRGANAADIISLSQLFGREDISYLAPEAAGNVWYPYSFLSPAAQNEPGRSSGLGVIAGLVAQLGEAGIPPERVALLGFSQGACLAVEFAARNPRRYGAVFGLSGGLIGDRIDPSDYPGSLDRTPVLIGCSDVDPHIPLARVKETTAVMKALGAEATERIYPGMPHTINEDEIAEIKRLLQGLR